MPSRIKRLQTRLADNRLDALLVTDPLNVRYLCGYTGSNGALLVTRKAAWFYTDFRYREQIRHEVKGCRKRVLARNLYAQFPVKDLGGVRRLGVEQAHLTLALYRLLRKQLKRVRLVPSPSPVPDMRRTKGPSELATIEHAQRAVEAAFDRVLPLLRPGTTERDIALRIEADFRRQGEVAFESIIASGPNGAKPHAGFSDRKLSPGDSVTIDIGCRIAGYCSDMTRTVFIGRARPELRRVYAIVLEAQQRALALIRPGARAADVDAAARDHIRQSGYAKEFGHSLGHGVGLAVHELPTLAATSKEVLAAGDVVTVEPGIYLPGIGGVRIEDMMLVTRAGQRNLTRTPKELLEL
jgi:Xaa-Pro aminopeptidase/Xaa-Pro dipeptidase